jgi:hypothetical protein
MTAFGTGTGLILKIEEELAAKESRSFKKN